MPQIAVYRGKVLVKEYTLLSADIVQLGRATANDIVLADKARRVSRYHAVLVRCQDSRDQFFVRDLGSRSAIYVNGCMVRRKILDDGDAVQIGGYRIVYSTQAVPSGQAGHLRVVPANTNSTAPDGSTMEFGSLGMPPDVALSQDRRELLEQVRQRQRRALSLRSYLAGFVPALARVVHADRGFVRLLGDKSGSVDADLGVVGLGPGDEIEIHDAEFLERLAQGQPVHEDRTVLVPLLTESKMAGFIALDRYRSGTPFTLQDIDFLMLLGRTIAERLEPEAEYGNGAGAADDVIEWPAGLIGKSRAIQELAVQIQKAASNDLNVLILGETGTGKELVARAIHQASGRKGDFVARNCGQTTETLAEAAIFGYTAKSAISEADPLGRPGWFEIANSGTLFLDEIQRLTPAMQDKFLRVLQDKEVWRIGARAPVRVDVKVLAATDQDVEQARHEGTLREPFYFRFGQTIRLPPLCKRKEDIPLLTYYFLDKYARSLDSKTHSVSHRALECLLQYDWPGNVRELEHCIQNAVSDNNEVVFSWDLPSHISGTGAGATLPGKEEVPPAKSEDRVRVLTMEEIEKAKIMEVLEQAHGNITAAGDLLGYKSRQTMLNKMDKYGIPRNYGDLAMA